MQYSYPIPLKSHKLLAAFTEKYMAEHNESPIYMIRVGIPDNVKQILDNDLARLGLSSSTGHVAFKRDTELEYNKLKYTHVDYDEQSDVVTNVSIIIPVKNCENTAMYWAAGDYQLAKSYDKFGNSKMDVVWNSPGTVVHEEQITVPTLVRVNIPHGAYSRQDGSYRMILSVRLKNNETFDQVVEKIQHYVDT
jgi:hypothetical protein